ncbi:hypothetical protein RI129_000769 [Pyrocoelia pectoralis]|uniref:Uncharacterized protein n=1 Tax=Pyrocoelia pectoralis TaxID=417401 RepID=A0AAN7VL36_9COLE
MARNSGGEEGEMDATDVEGLVESRKLMRELRQKTRAQSQQIIAWRRAYKLQENLVWRLQREKADQLKFLSSKLLLFESRLIRKQKDISTLLNHRENIIHRQQRIIETLVNRLVDNGLELPHRDLSELDTNLLDLDSLNDSDSAVVMEDVDSDSNVTHIPRFRSTNAEGVTVVRSVSDAIDPNLKYTARRSNGFLRRPEILETVYSVEEDGDNDSQSENKIDAIKKRDAFASQRSEKAILPIDDQGELNRVTDNSNIRDWPYNCTKKTDESDKVNTGANQVTTYNRVMSNHRSVTKPKDVKYKRINKAKSKSLEELRGRLKNWVEQGSKLPGLTLEHSQSYA